MKSLLFISHDRQTNKWVKLFSEKNFKVRTKPTAEEGLQDLIQNKVDIVLFDLDKQEMSLEQFLEGMRQSHVLLPLLSLSSAAASHQELQDRFPELMGHLSKPFSQMVFQETLAKALADYTQREQEELSKGKSVDQLRDSEFLVGVRLQATIYKVSKKGMVLFLPTAIANGTRLIFKGKPLYRQIGLQGADQEKIEMWTTHCVFTADNRFQSDNPIFQKFGTCGHNTPGPVYRPTG